VELNLSKNRISSQGVELVMNSLKLNTTLISLELSQNQLGDDGGESIGGMLLVNTTLRKLGVQFSGIEQFGFNSITKSIAINSTLLSLDLRGNRIVLEEKNVDEFWMNKFIVEIFEDDEWRGEEESEVRLLEARNLSLWEERMGWCITLHLIARVLLRGIEHILPWEMVYHILSFVPPETMKKEMVKKVLKYANDRSTLKGEMNGLMEMVFGKGIDMVMRKVERAINFRAGQQNKWE